MKKISVSLLALLAMTLMLTSIAFAGSAYNASWTTSVTYQNMSSSTANVMFSFYPENNGTPIVVNKTLAPNAGSSIFMGSVSSISAGFSGSGVASSDQPIVATLVQVSSDGDVKNRPLSNGFSQGSSSLYLATLLKNKFSSNSRFSIQNADSSAVDITVKIYDADNLGATPITVTHNNLPVGAAKSYDMGSLSNISASVFNGSAVVTAVKTGTSTPANIVGTVLELNTSNGKSSAFESIASGSSTLYAPSAICDKFGANTAYAVQNVATSGTASVTVTYSNGQTDAKSIPAGAKASFSTCNVISPGFSGAATITSTGGDIIAVAKVFGGIKSVAFPLSGTGASKLALPYVRYTSGQWDSGARQRAFIAVQNVGSALNSGDVTVKYYDKNGALVATHTLGAMANGAKLNSNANNSGLVLASGKTAADLQEFGYIGGFGGGVIIEGPAGSQLVATTRINSNTSAGIVSEDYTGIAP